MNLKEIKKDLKMILLLAIFGISINFIFRYLLTTFDDIRLQEIIFNMMPVLNLLFGIFLFFVIFGIGGIVFFYFEERKKLVKGCC